MDGQLRVRKRRWPWWKKRYFKLTGQRLRCYANCKNASSLKQDYCIADCTIRKVDSFLCDGKPFGFEIELKDKGYLLLCAFNEKACSDWITRIKESSGKKMVHLNSLTMDTVLSPSSRVIGDHVNVMVDDVVNIYIQKSEDRMDECWRSTERKLILKKDVHGAIAGSVLVQVNRKGVVGNSTQTLVEMKLSGLPMQLKLVCVKEWKGHLKVMPYAKWKRVVKRVPTSSIQLGKATIDPWKKKECVVRGDTFRCVHSVAMGMLANLTPHKETVVRLENSTVKLVHKVLAEREFCFLLSCGTTHLLLQAKDQEELVEWMARITHAIDMSRGILTTGKNTSNARPRTFSSELELQYIENRKIENTQVSENDATRPPLVERRRSLSVNTTSSSPIWLKSIQVDGMDRMIVLQHCDYMLEAIQLLKTQTFKRSTLWPKLFDWGLHALPDCTIQQLSNKTIAASDLEQLEKDLPRTSKWLENSKKAPQLSAPECELHLQNLKTILHAMVACLDTVKSTTAQHDVHRHAHISYLQGMNGIGFVLLHVLENVQVAYQILTSTVLEILPCVFHGPTEDAFENDNLVQTGQVLERILYDYLPDVSRIFETVGLPTSILAYKWFPTLFSDISLTSGNRQLPFDTLLASWDVCFLMGMEGVFIIAIALFSAAQSSILQLGTHCLAEHVAETLNNTFSTLSPDHLLDSVTIVLQTLSDESLSLLRKSHLKKFKHVPKHLSKIIRNVQAAQTSTKVNIDINPSNYDKAKCIRNLDTGQVFPILSIQSE